MIKRPKNIPTKSGVYLFRSKKSEILYVGRAVNLKNRLANYFQKNLNPRIAEMVSLANEVEIRTTDNLLDAIILEANLIKEHWPKYNVKDKDNRSFVYLVIPKADYPRPLIVRARELKKFPQTGKNHHVFGPYQSVSLLKNALKIIRRIFPYSTCQPNSGKPCFHRQINLCPGVCTGEISQKDYQKVIKNIALLLSGEKRHLLKKLARENPDQAKALTHIQDVALLTGEKDINLAGSGRIEAYDISHLAGKETYGAMAVFMNNKADKTQYRLFKIKNDQNDDLRSLEEMLRRRFNHREWPWPEIILIDGGRPQIGYLAPVLRTLKIEIPMIGISKFGGDVLVFSAKTSPKIKELARSIKKTLLAARDEAHRFGLNASRRKRKLI